MRFATNRGVRIAYVIRGEGPPVVLLMGLSLPGAVWRHRMEELVEHGFRVAIPDNRGTGASDTPWPPYSMRILARDVTAVMDDAGMESAIVAGVSFGGMVAQHVALDHPDRVDGLLLVSTTCGFPTGRLATPTAIWLFAKMILAPDQTTADDMGRLLAHPETTDRLHSFLERTDELLQESPTPFWATLGQLTAVLSHHTGRRLDEIRVPTRVMTGDSDILIPPENSRILADRIPGASLRVVERAGHIATHEHPECLLEEILALHDQIA